MPPVPESVIAGVLHEYGLLGLAVIAIACLAGTCLAQLVALRRFSVATTSIIDKFGSLTANQDRQHATCSMHYTVAREQTVALQSMAGELRGLVEQIHASDIERARELMAIILKMSERRTG
jgi:hypothetical protein